MQRKKIYMTMKRIHKTEKGTELPLLNLKGKDYLEVKYRLVWFREEHPTWSIETQFLTIDERSACARAVVKDENGRIIATSHKQETAGNFPDFMEKAETGAIGRALALIGYGTQFCADELDEGDRIVDAPVAKRSSYGVALKAPRPGARPDALSSSGKGESSVPGVKSAVSSAHPPQGEASAKPGSTSASGDIPFDLGEFQVNFGKKYLGKRLKEIPRKEIESYVDWLEKKAAEKNAGPGYEVEMLKQAVDRFHNPEKYLRAADSPPMASAEKIQAGSEAAS
jgi:hypothetical protein